MNSYFCEDTMKQFLILGLCAILAGCSGFVENRETRSTIYEGQTTWDMYENFGAPVYAIRITPNETHFVFRREDTTREWTNVMFNWCDMTVSVIDDHVVDWDISGNQCYLNVADPVEVPDSNENPRENKLFAEQNLAVD